MSRFSPTVLPTSGRSLAQALGMGVNTYLATRERKRQQDIEDEQRQRAESVQNATLGEQGIHLTKPGELPPTFDVNVSGGPNPDDITSAAILHQPTPTGQPLATALSRHLSIGPGYYIDRDEQAANAQRGADAKFQALLAEALAKGKAADIVNPGGRQADVAYKQALTKQALAQAEHASQPTPRNIDPNSPEGIAAAVQKARAMQGILQTTHAANRTYDVAHPMPAQDNAKMTEFSNKAALVYPRAAEAATLLEPFFQSGIPASSMLGKVTFGQYGVSPEIQKANQAAETVASAILRLESGAAISEHEVKEYAKQFLPQPGDSPEVLAQKRATLQTQLERMRQAASPTMRRDVGGSAPRAPLPSRGAPSGNVNLGDTAGKTITVNGKTFKVPE